MSSFTVTGAADVPLVGLGAVCGKGGHVTIPLGLNLFLGVALFLFSVESLFLMLGFVSGSGGG